MNIVEVNALTGLFLSRLFIMFSEMTIWAEQLKIRVIVIASIPVDMMQLKNFGRYIPRTSFAFSKSIYLFLSNICDFLSLGVFLVTSWLSGFFPNSPFIMAFFRAKSVLIRMKVRYRPCNSLIALRALSSFSFFSAFILTFFRAIFRTVRKRSSACKKFFIASRTYSFCFRKRDCPPMTIAFPGTEDIFASRYVRRGFIK